MPTNGLKHPVMLVIWVLLRSVLLLSILPAPSQGQITLDGSLGPRGPLAGPNYRIDANVGQIRGSNLFHSFGQFNVRTDESATFAGPNTITNVVGRVTGGEQSFIDGRLRSEIAGANLFLLNPSGVLFGPNAKLDVGGSFHISTADFLRFADGAKFFANLGQESVLTVASPAAFGFLGNNPAAITINGSSLKVSEGKALSAVGGDITIIGNGPLMGDSAPTLGASGGRIQLASVASPGEVVFSRLDLAPDLQVESFTRLGRLELSRGAFLDASGNGGGSALLRSGRLRVDGAWIFADNNGPVNGAGLGVDLQVTADAVITNRAFLTADSLGTGRARDLRLTGGSVQIDNSTVGSRPSASGNGGDVGLNVGKLTLMNGGEISASTSGRGHGGTLTVAATEAIVISGPGSGLFSNAFSLGDAGQLSLSTPLLTMDAGLIQALAAAGSGGNAGNLDVRVGRLVLSGGAQLDSSTRSSGRGGTLTVAATETISIAGRDRRTNNPSGLFSQATGSGDAGRLSVSAPTLSLQEGQMLANTTGAGGAGDLAVQVGRLALTDGAQINASTSGRGHGGTLTVAATEAIAISGPGSGLFSNAFSLGDAGQLSLSTPLLTMDEGLIQALAAAGSGGNAGNLDVRVGRLVLSGGAQLDSSTRSSGRGGTLTVAATETISIVGRDRRTNNPSGLFAGRLSLSTPLLSMDAGLLQTVADLDNPGNIGGLDVRVGRLTLTGGARISSSTQGVSRGGDVTVMATDGISIAGSASGLFSSTAGIGDAGRLSLSTPLLTMDAGLIQANAELGSRGNAGSIAVQAGRLTLTGGAQISSSSFGTGRGGNVTVVATDAISISGSASRLFSSTLVSGDAGRLSVSAPTLSIMDGGAIEALASGYGNAGEISVEAGRLMLTGGATISSLALGSGKGSNVMVSARESVSIAGHDDQGTPSEIVGFAAGDPGRLSLSAPTVTIDGGVVGTPSFALGGFIVGTAGNMSVKADNLIMSGGARLSTSTITDSAGGNITIETGRLALTEGAQINASTSGRGHGGTLTVAATEAIAISGPGSGLFSNAVSLGDAGQLSISTPLLTMDAGLIQALAAAGSGGNAGNLDVRVGRLVLSGGAQLDSSTRSSGRGGTLTVAATETISIAGRDRRTNNPSGLFSQATGSGDAGRLSVSAPTLSLQEGQMLANTTGAGGAGDLAVQVGRLALTDGAQINASTSGRGHGGTLTVAATEAIAISGPGSGLFSNAFSLGDAGQLSLSTPLLTMDEGLIQALAAAGSGGNAGNLDVRVGRLVLSGGAQLDSSTRSSGRGGTLTVAATETISIAGRDRRTNNPSGLFSQATGSGAAGRLFVSAPTLSLQDGQILASTTGAGGAGDLALQVGRLALTEGAQISSSTSGRGHGGTLTVAATEALLISGPGSGLFSNAFSLGDAGQLSISTPLLTMDAGLIQALAAAGSSGNAGNLDVRVGRLVLSGGAQLDSSTRSSGRGGNVTVAATEQVELSTGGIILASSSAKGDAGSIVIRAGNIFRSRNGAVTTEAEQSDGGNIQLTVGSLVDLRDSQLTATVKSGVGKGGNITIDPRFVILEGSQIRADAFGGPGGNVRIVSDVFLRDPASLVSASSALGIQGTVDIRAPVTSLSGVVAPLPQAFVSAAELLPARCAARLSGGRYSSLVVGGRDGLPLDPAGVLPSPLEPDESVVDPSVTGNPNQQKTLAKFTLLAVADKVFLRLYGGNLPWRCSK